MKTTRLIISAAALVFILSGCSQNDNSSSKPTVKKVTESAKSENVTEFKGVLIDEDCSDFEDPPLHETNCMFMEECRDSGYGIDIKQDDGSWVFYEFDDYGKELAWEYLNSTDRLDGLYITVTGELSGNIIKVSELKETQE